MRETYAQAPPDSPANPAEFFTLSALVQPMSEAMMLVTGMGKLTESPQNGLLSDELRHSSRPGLGAERFA